MKIEIAVIIVSIILPFCLGSCNADWWIGQDNGEAYMRYQEEMQRYEDEHGIPQDIYGYGWGK